MTQITAQLFRELVAEARLAPSIHNIQPTRWRLAGANCIQLVDDLTVRAPIADPAGHDVRVSHGAALEGMSLALGRRGLSIGALAVAEERLSQDHAVLCSLTVDETGDKDALADSVLARMSWRGSFVTQHDDDRGFDSVVEAHRDVVCIRDRSRIAEIAALGDEADLFFLRKPEYRHELVQWMRFSPSHPRYDHDGLNRDALALAAAEGFAAKLVLGPLFAPLDQLHLARALISDRHKTASAAGLVLFVRPRDEDPLLTGRHFYRLWLAIDRAGFAACPISALADHADINRRLCELAAVDRTGHRLVNIFRVGRPATSHRPLRHFRWPVDSLIVQPVP